MRRSIPSVIRCQLFLLLIALMTIVLLSTIDPSVEENTTLDVGDVLPQTKVGRLPDCIIIGVRKAGTRIVLALLNRNPRVKIVGPELGFFNSVSNYQRGLSWYSQQMPNATTRDVVIEKTADYFQYSEAPARIHAMNPTIKLILVIRDPIERLISDYHFIRRYAARVNSSYNFLEVNTTLEDLIINVTTSKLNYGYGAIFRSSYAKLILPWLYWFPRDQIHVVNGDVIAKNNPAPEIRQVEKFLGLRQYTRDNHFYFDDKKGYWCLRGGCFGDEKGHTHPPLREDARLRLYKHFWRLNRDFCKIMGEDFGWS